ncbi:MAG TPA: YidB family protein [Pseudolabrys sp.]
MGLLDILNGMQNGPRGQTKPAPAGSGGMSPIAMALLGLVAYKAIKQLSPGQPSTAPANRGTSTAGGTASGGLGGLLQGPLGGLLAGGAAGSVLSGGLNDLLKQFQQGGQSDVVQSWIGTGPNKSISTDILSKVLSDDQIRTISAQSGMSRDDLIATLSQQLPELVNQLTPDGRIPTEREASRLI